MGRPLGWRRRLPLPRRLRLRPRVRSPGPDPDSSPKGGSLGLCSSPRSTSSPFACSAATKQWKSSRSGSSQRGPGLSTPTATSGTGGPAGRAGGTDLTPTAATRGPGPPHPPLSLHFRPRGPWMGLESHFHQPSLGILKDFSGWGRRKGQADTRDLDFPFQEPGTPPGPQGLLEFGILVSSSTACWRPGKLYHIPRLGVSPREKPSSAISHPLHPLLLPPALSSLARQAPGKIGTLGEGGR